MNRILMNLAVMMSAAAVSILPFGEASATNGMNLEGYGPISTAMGGASLAFDNGMAAVMNNPATIGLMTGTFRADLALGVLGPDVTASVNTMSGQLSSPSQSTSFLMPAFGVALRRDEFVFGLGVFSQGGMGAEFDGDSWLSDPSMGANSALTEGLVNRSEVGVGRAIIPVTYDVNEKLTIGGSADFVWAGIDLRMALGEGQFVDLADPATRTLGSADGSLVEAFKQLYEPAPFNGSGIERLYHAYFDFDNFSDWTGAAKGYGVAAKLGAVYRYDENLTFGATYHTKTSLGDLEADIAKMRMGVSIDPGIFVGSPTGTYQDMNMLVKGSVKIKDFQWPAMIGAGVAYRPVEELLLAMDVKYILWSGVMDDFRMVFKADDSQENGPFAGLEMEASLLQEWEDQVVIAFGGAYDATEDLTLRAGYNFGKNPVPDKYLNALFPAIVESHLTFGAGYRINESITGNAAFVYGFESEYKYPGNGSTIPEVGSTHSQFNWQVMFSYVY